MPSLCPIPPGLSGMQRGTTRFIAGIYLEVFFRGISCCFSPFYSRFPPRVKLWQWIPTLLFPFCAGKANQVGSGRCSRIIPPSGREKRVDFPNKSQLSFSMCRAPRKSGSGLALGVPFGKNWGHVSCAKATQILQLMDLTCPREIRLGQELMGKEKKLSFGKR